MSAHPVSPSPMRRPLDPTTLLTAVPALIGFLPERSIVVVAFHADRSPSATMRHDLLLDERGAPSPELSGLFADLAAITVSYGVEEVVVAIADDRHPLDGLVYRQVLSIADREFSAIGGVAAGFAVADFHEGAEWTTIWCPDDQAWAVDMSGPRSGALEDPLTSPSAVEAAVRSGRHILARRSQIRAMLEPRPGECSAQRPDLWCGGCAAGDGTGIGVGPASQTQMLELVLEAVVAAGPPVECRRLADLDRALGDPDVRDALLGLAVTDLRDRAEVLWRELARRLAGRGRAAAATLLAHLHYVGGEGAYAGTALDVALDSDPGYTVALALDQCLRSGMRPAKLSELTGVAYDTAARLGVRLPPVTRQAAG
ncbi:DUF4192 domain-containing protein [Gordonia aurantiaca]|uniref:DUF4192 domain-containing protein n=1 Tax=Gordonia sp. B21 TaxID=3151852 RepID=UPI003264A775